MATYCLLYRATSSKVLAASAGLYDGRRVALDRWNYVPPPRDYFDEDWLDEDWHETTTISTRSMKIGRGRPGKGLRPD